MDISQLFIKNVGVTIIILGIKMIFSSFAFIFAFLPIVWIVFYLLKKCKICKTLHICKNFFDFIKSFFYGFWKIAYLPILLSSIFVNFFLAKRLLNNKITGGGTDFTSF